MSESGNNRLDVEDQFKAELVGLLPNLLTYISGKNTSFLEENSEQ